MVHTAVALKEHPESVGFPREAEALFHFPSILHLFSHISSFEETQKPPSLLIFLYFSSKLHPGPFPTTLFLKCSEMVESELFNLRLQSPAFSVTDLVPM